MYVDDVLNKYRRFSLLIVTILLALSMITFAHAVSYDDKNTLESVVTFRNSFTIIPTSSSYDIKFINASITSYPRDDLRQSVGLTTSNPKAIISDDSMSFLYDHPTQDQYLLEVESHVTTRNMIDEIKQKPIFPLGDIDGGFYAYLEPTETIDITPQIRNLASELIGDKTDQYEIEYTLAEYVRKNIAYDLGTLTSDVDQKSSWVLDNKRGVCDEITNLFISLNRASGIPARFVSGVAYTNLDEVFGKNWVPHAWAEVYYPGIGWVPYDVTYGQYGFIDSGHIKLLASQDSVSSNVNYNYLGRNIQLKPGSIDIDVKVLNYGETSHGRYSFSAKAYDNEVGFGSYDLISVNVENTKDYYQVADLYLADTRGVTIMEDSKETVLNKTIHRRQVLLRPRDSQTIYWIVKIDTDLNPSYVYTMPITVYNTYNESSVTFIQSREDYKTIGMDYFKDMISTSTSESSKPYSKNIYLECTASNSSIYLEDSADISCILDNKGDRQFEKVNICIDDECTSRGLQVQKVPLQYSKRFNATGLKNVAIKAYNDEFTKVIYIPINVLDKPNVSIIDLDHPSSADYGTPFEISFKVHKLSKSVPESLKVKLKSEAGVMEWSFPEFTDDRSFTIKSNGDALKPYDNHYVLTVEYSDDKGGQYEMRQEFTIRSNATFLENILLYLNFFGRTVEQAFSG